MMVAVLEKVGGASTEVAVSGIAAIKLCVLLLVV